MKMVRVVLKVLIVVVVLVVVAVLAMPLWFGPVVKTVANAAVPGIVKTDFRMERLSLNPYTARFELGDLNLANPPGYVLKDAVRVGCVVLDAEPRSLMTDVIHIEEIAVRDLFVSLVSGGENNVLNFKQIQNNVSGGSEGREAAASGADAAARPAADQGDRSGKSAKKIIIDRLEVSGLTIQLGILPIRIPSFVLTDIGRERGGMTLEEAWQQIVDGVAKSAGVVGAQLKAATAAMGGASEKISATASQAASSVNSTVGAATDAVGDGAKAVGDGAKKAMDSLKSLW